MEIRCARMQFDNASHTDTSKRTAILLLVSIFETTPPSLSACFASFTASLCFFTQDCTRQETLYCKGVRVCTVVLVTGEHGHKVCK